MVPLRVIGLPGAAGLGSTDPLAEGGVLVKLMVALTMTLSIARPSSVPEVSTSFHRIQIELPGSRVRPVMTPEILFLQARLVPSVGPWVVEQAAPGDAKFSRAKLT